MTTDVAAPPEKDPRDLALVQEGGYGFAADDVKLIAEQVCRPKDRMATYAELRLFLAQAQATGLNPIANQVYAVFRKNRRAVTEEMTIQTGIDGFRLIAERSKAYLGQSGPYWYDPTDGGWHEVWLKDSPPAAAKVIVRKAVGSHIAETPAVAHYREYVPLWDNQPTGLWKTMPANMIAKCAEALALRKAFPNDLSGIYVTEEMEQADVLDGQPARGAAAADLTARAERMEAADAEIGRLPDGSNIADHVNGPPTDVPPVGPGFTEPLAHEEEPPEAEVVPEAQQDPTPEPEEGDMESRIRDLLTQVGEDPAMIAARMRGAKTPASMKALLTYAEGEMAKFAAKQTSEEGSS